MHIPLASKRHFNLGNKLDDLAKYIEAKHEYELAIEIEPRFPQAHMNLGNVLRKLNRCEESIYHYKEALKYDKDNKMVHFNYGMAFICLGQHINAISELEIAVSLDGNYSIALSELAQCYAVVGNNGRAFKHSFRAILLSPKQFNYYGSFGYVCLLSLCNLFVPGAKR